jgi:hypothetical protein
MSELIKLELGDSTKISVRIVPVFIPLTKTLTLTGGTVEHPTVTESTRTFECSISMKKESCTISSNIQNVEFRWVLKRSDKVELVSSLHPEKITLTRSETSDAVKFEAKNLRMPLMVILIDNIAKLAGNMGTISARISIENLEQIEIAPEPAIEWDFSYKFSTAIKGKDYDLATLAYNSQIIGSHVNVKFNKGKSYPASYKGYLIVWENDTWEDINRIYSCKNQSGNVFFKGNSISEVQSSSLMFVTSAEQKFYMGCTSEHKLNYGNNEDDMTGFEFNGLFVIASDLSTVISPEYKQINALPPFVRSRMNVFTSPCPMLSISRQKTKDIGKAITYTVNLLIKNISSSINMSGISFSMQRKQADGSYSKDATFASMYMLPDELKYEIIHESISVPYGIPSDLPEKGEIQSSIKIKFMAPKDSYLKEFILVFPL